MANKPETVICKICGNEIPKKAKVCPKCGVKQRKHTVLKVILAIFIISFVVNVFSDDDSSDKPKSSSTTKTEQQEKKPEKKEKDEPEPVSVDPIVNIDTTDYLKVDAEVLFEYNAYWSGQKVVTAITADNIDTYSGMIKTHTSNNDSFFFSVACEFDDKSVLDSIEEGDILTVAGTLDERSSTFSALETPTASLKRCSIIGYGEIADELKAGAAEQREIGEQAKQAYEAQIAAAKKEEKDSYISQCETVTYSDVERNPDNYDGKFVKFTGKVVQVSEGLFDSVTMRIDSGGNMWYVTYIRSEGESRILEGDKITCYGECDGVTSYTTVLGSQVTIPSMSMKYYE